jgi:hypothetical protein
MLVLWGIGSTFGPLLAAFGMQALGTGALFPFVTAVSLGLFVFLVLRLNAKRRTKPATPPDITIEGPP